LGLGRGTPFPLFLFPRLILVAKDSPSPWSMGGAPPPPPFFFLLPAGFSGPLPPSVKHMDLLFSPPLRALVLFPPVTGLPFFFFFLPPGVRRIPFMCAAFSRSNQGTVFFVFFFDPPPETLFWLVAWISSPQRAEPSFFLQKNSILRPGLGRLSFSRIWIPRPFLKRRMGLPPLPFFPITEFALFSFLPWVCQ